MRLRFVLLLGTCITQIYSNLNEPYLYVGYCMFLDHRLVCLICMHTMGYAPELSVLCTSTLYVNVDVLCAAPRVGLFDEGVICVRVNLCCFYVVEAFLKRNRRRLDFENAVVYQGGMSLVAQ